MSFHATEERPLLISIDLGIVNIGICIVDMRPSLGGERKFKFIQHSLLKPKSGQVYKEYSEGYVDELVENFLRDFWEAYFSKAFLILIERQMNSPGAFTVMERACLVVEISLRTYLRAQRAHGGAPCCVVSPREWKHPLGLIEQGASQSVEKTAKNVNPNRAKHKGASRDYFYHLLREAKDEDILSIMRDHGSRASYLTTDQIEAFLLARYYLSKPSLVWDKAKLRSHHHAKLTAEIQEEHQQQPTTRKRLTKRARETEPWNPVYATSL